MLDPKGPVGIANRAILFDSLAIMLAIVVPTIIAVFLFAFWFREGNRRAAYRPEWAYSGQIELVVWAVPAMVVLLLGGISWIGSHDLDPSRPLAEQAKPIEIEVVALDWKWLFIDRAKGVASVNRLVVPAATPIRFHITSATVMNSFFVPQLGSQIYAMAGMVTQLNLEASKPGRYEGRSVHYSGAGFADMTFVFEAVTQDGYAAYIAANQGKAPVLDRPRYARLAQRSAHVAPEIFGGVEPGLFEAVVHQQAPAPQPPSHKAGRTEG